MSNLITALIVTLALLFGIVRVYIGLTVPVHGPALLWVTIYKDLAHVYVGLLIGFGWYGSIYDSSCRRGWCHFLRSGDDALSKRLAIGLCVLEVAVAALGRM